MKKRFIALLVKTALFGLALYVVFGKLIGVAICRQNHMHPSIRDGDIVVFSRVSVFRTGDVVAYEKDGSLRLSRIAAEYGCEVNIPEDGGLLINGCVPSDELFYRTERLQDSDILYPHKVEEGSFFLLDDHRLIGNDSRSFGDVSKERIAGKALLVIRRRGI